MEGQSPGRVRNVPVSVSVVLTQEAEGKMGVWGKDGDSRSVTSGRVTT